MLCFLSTHAQNEIPDQTIYSNDSITGYKYKDPSYYLEKAGGLGQFKSGFIIVSTVFTTIILLNNDDLSTGAALAVPTTFGVMAYLIDLAIYNNTKRAGLAMKERGLYIGGTSNGVGLKYKF